MLTAKRKKQIQLEAEKVLREQGALKVGVDLERVLKDMCVELHVVDHLTDRHSGFSVSMGSRKIIGIKSSEKESPRGRFTMAHELGHLVLHQSSLVNYSAVEVFYRHTSGPEKHDIKEYEANYFAACFLMPEQLVQNYAEDMISEMGITSSNIERMADDFKVSESAMTVRLAQLGFSLF